MSLGRRTVLVGALSSIAGLAGSPAFARGLRSGAERSLAFDNLHTGERLRTAYWADGAYLPEALRRIDWVLRDHRADATHPIAPALLDLLHALARTLDTRSFSVISGYRSPRTNAMLASHSSGVAKRSLHTVGMAIDVRVPGIPLTTLRDAARRLGGGGVGFYPRSDFVHVDVGRVRYW